MKKKEIHKLVKLALKEDVPNGDITSNLTVSRKVKADFQIIAKEDFILCGVEFVKYTFLLKNINIFEFFFKDGDKIEKGQVIVQGRGSAKNILLVERVILNFLQYLSGISSRTHKFVEKTKHYNTQILDTRKTLPLYRNASKYAVRVGGGKNHRYNLSDQILIKDNHIVASGGVLDALELCKRSLLIKEIECEDFDQIKEALKSLPDIIMLDNMNLRQIKEAIILIEGKTKVEVSGNIKISQIEELCKIDVDFISVGELTHSVQATDISLKLIIN